MSLKQKTISGLFWSFSDSALNYFIQFIIGIILARLLEPTEFGIIGMITVFIAVSQSFIDSGFTQALIRKKNATHTDFSTIFYFNLGIGFLFYVIIYTLSGSISDFYGEPILKPIIKVFGLILIINSLTIIQRARLTKAINFKLQTKVSFLASIISGIISIYLAYKGFGVWSLVWKSLINQLLQSAALWHFNNWMPSLLFSKKSFLEMFAFGSKLLVSGLIDTLYRNIYILVIGKFFSAQTLGFYTRADQFQKLPSQNITSAVQRVSYPVLSTLQDDPEKLKLGYRKIIKATMFISFTSMLCMASFSESMVLILIGEKWLPSVPYFRLLCFAGMLYPLHAINLNMLNVMGRSDLFLKLEIIKKFLAVPFIIIGIIYGMNALLMGIVINSFLAYIINSYYSGSLINYPLSEQIGDIFPSLILASFVAALIFIPSILIDLNPIIMFFSQMIAGIMLNIVLSEILKIDGYIEIKNIIFGKIKDLHNHV